VHEYGIVQALLDQVEEVARARGASAVRGIHLRIGELAGVENELLTTAFGAFREGTLCAGAELAIHAQAARWECPGCGAERRRGEILRCPACGRPARLVAGEDIVLERVELEVT